MNRRIVYPGQIPLDSDSLVVQRNVQMTLGHLASSVLGTGTIVAGLAVIPSTPAGLSVTVGSGTLIAQGVADQNAFGSIGTNSAQTSIIYTKDDTTSFSLATPGTAGQAINYLIQVQGTTTDTDLVVLPYYNSANPAQASQGVNGTGQAQPTSRKDNIVLTLKPGTPAAQGSQQTPSADSGFYPLAIVTVAYGATQVTTGNIAAHPQAPYQTSLGNLQATILAALQSGTSTFCLDTSTTSNSIVCSLTPAPTAYTPGLTFTVKVANPTTGAATINLNGLGAKSLRNSDSSNVSNGEIVAGQIIQVVYDGSVFQIGGANPSSVSNTVFQVSGAMQRIVRAANYTVQTTDRSALLGFTGTQTLTLPAASATAGPVNFTFFAKNVGTGDLSIAVTGSDTADGIIPSIVNNQITQAFSAWNAANATITPNFAAGIDNSQTAARVQLNANPGAEVDTALTGAVPSAATLAVWVKGTSASQTFRFGLYTGATVSPSADQTATTSWQRFTLSVPVGVTKVSIMAASSSAAADLTVWGARVEAGTTSSAYVMYPGELRLFSSDGVSAWVSDVFAPFDRTYLTSGAFVAPPGYPHLFIAGMGAGGGGCAGGNQYYGTGTSASGRGGCGAAYDERVIDKSTYTAGLPITVAVAAGGIGANEANIVGEIAGQDGGASSFGSFLSIVGGQSFYADTNKSIGTYLGDGDSQSPVPGVYHVVRGGGRGGPGMSTSYPGVIQVGGLSRYAGSGGNGGTNTVHATDGQFPGGGGGGSLSGWGANPDGAAAAGIKAGNGANGYIRVAGRLS